ncbi:MAG: ankyrin repeat domain-containing protein, partial [Chthoniobacterales bacterium]
FAIAREYGFKSWTHLKQRLEPGNLPPPWKQLRAAIDADDVEKLQTILANHPELLNQPLHEGEDGYFNQNHTSLAYAAQGGRVRSARYLAEKYPYLLHRPDHRGKTPINTLAHTMATGCEPLSSARREIYDYFKLLGAKPDLANAAKANDIENVEELLRQGADPYASAFLHGRLADGPAFVTAADAGNAETVKLFLKSAHPNSQIAFDAFSRALLTNHWDVIHLIEPFVPRERLSECLCGCCEFLNLEGVEFLLRKGADPNIQIKPKDSRSYPLLIALDTYSRKPWRGKVIETLINAGATQWHPSSQMAIHRGRADLLAEYLDKDSTLIHRKIDEMESPQQPDLKGATLLHLAAKYNELECAKLLLEKGADINAKQPVNENGIGGGTPIFRVVACYKNFGIPLLRLFIERGADFSVEATFQQERLGFAEPEEPIKVTPLGWARCHEHGWPEGRSTQEEIAMLRTAGAPE